MPRPWSGGGRWRARLLLILVTCAVPGGAGAAWGQLPDTVSTREFAIYADRAFTDPDRVTREFAIYVDRSQLPEALTREFGLYVDPSHLAEALTREFTLSVELNSRAEATTREFGIYVDRSTEADAVTREFAVFAGPLYTEMMVLDPRDTYFRTNEDPEAHMPLVIPLSAIRAVAGDPVQLCRRGDFAFHPGDEEIGMGIGAVFSRTDYVNPDPSVLHRVPDRVPVGSPPQGVPGFVSPATFHGDLLTDIPEDFSVYGCVTAIVPDSALYLVVGALDVFYGDNTDLDADFALRLVNLNVTDVPVDPGETTALSERFGISPVVPNPSIADCRFSVNGVRPLPGDVMIVDAGGRRVTTLTPESSKSGRSGYRWDGLDNAGKVVPAGVYFVRVRNGNDGASRTIIRLK